MSGLQARCHIVFPRIADFLDTIIDALGAHDMRVHREGDVYIAVSPYGTATVTPGIESLDLVVQSETGIGLNRVRHSLTGLIAFNAKTENLRIDWTGDTAGHTLPPDLRVLSVQDVSDITPMMRRVTFTGDDLSRFAVSDQLHVRLLFQPKDITVPEWPLLDDQGGIVWPGGKQRIGSRVYTIRSIDPEARKLTIDFFIHRGQSGPGIDWARSVQPGMVVGMLGPAAHGPKPAGRYVLVGDETGLPGIARILEELPDGAQGTALIEIGNREEEQDLAAPRGFTVLWLHRDRAAPRSAGRLEQAVRALSPWPPDTFAWVGCEFHAFRAIRSFLLNDAKILRSQLIAFPHWRRGMSEEDIVAAGGDAVAG